MIGKKDVTFLVLRLTLKIEFAYNATLMETQTAKKYILKA